MNVLGIEYFPPNTFYSIGGADNYFPWPGRQNQVVWGGVTDACPDWMFARSIGTCNISTGNPSRVVHRKKRCILRAFRAFNAEATSIVYIREWHNNSSKRHARFELLVQPGVPSSLQLGLYGVDIGQMPFVQTTGKVSFEMVYDVA